ncbi:MAG: HupE/UreJ family protein, partial [Thiobacillus sp.]
MNLKKHSRTFALAALGLFAGTASAHTGDHATVTGFVGGLAHPLLGIDPLFAMIAIGLWAAQLVGRALW